MPLEQFPYTNFHELNLDWIIQKVKYFDEHLDEIVNNAASEYFASIMANTLYDEANSKIILDFSGGNQ